MEVVGGEGGEGDGADPVVGDVRGAAWLGSREEEDVEDLLWGHVLDEKGGVGVVGGR